MKDGGDMHETCKYKVQSHTNILQRSPNSLFSYTIPASLLPNFLSLVLHNPYITLAELPAATSIRYLCDLRSGLSTIFHQVIF